MLGSGWIIDQVQDIHININNYDPLAGSSYIQLPPITKFDEGLINIKNKNIECFRWCHVRMLNPQTKDACRIKKEDRKIAELLNYSATEFPIKEKHYPLIERRFNVNLNVFYYEKIVYSLYISQQNNEQVLNIIFISDGEKSHYVFIKDFNSLMY